MDYKRKLLEWNNTDKYRSELLFLCHVMNLKRHDQILDYGCGIGTAVKWLRSIGMNAWGFDVSRYAEGSWFKESYDFQFNKIYLMHSLAHIDHPHAALDVIKSMLAPGGRIFIVTPNADWLTFKNEGRKVVTDDTVVRHFSALSLLNLIEGAGYRIIQQGQFGDCIMNQHERLFLIAEK